MFGARLKTLIVFVGKIPRHVSVLCHFVGHDHISIVLRDSVERMVMTYLLLGRHTALHCHRVVASPRSTQWSATLPVASHPVLHIV